MYSNVTKQGYEIISKVRDDYDYLHVIVKRKDNDYAVGLYYDEKDGTWAQGLYDFRNLQNATIALFKREFGSLEDEEN